LSVLWVSDRLISDVLRYGILFVNASPIAVKVWRRMLLLLDNER